MSSQRRRTRGSVRRMKDAANQARSQETSVDGSDIVDLASVRDLRAKRDLTRSEWRALLAARWTLVDELERDGQRYLLVRRRVPPPKGLEALTPREREALALARRGHNNKSIAYEMGITASTVAVLLGRAAKRLGCDRAELIATYARLTRGE